MKSLKCRIDSSSRWRVFKGSRFLISFVLLVIFIVSMPFLTFAIQNIFVQSNQVTDIQIGDIPVNYVYKEDQLVWSRSRIFSYTGDLQEFIVLREGYYEIELWGASGAGNSARGQGGYTSGIIYSAEGEIFHIYVGQVGNRGITGTNSPAVVGKGGEATFNGGGRGGNAGGSGTSQWYYSRYSGGMSGGGATDMRYFVEDPSETELAWNSEMGLKSRLMVSGGGGGNGHWDGSYDKSVGRGGGLYGESGSLDASAASDASRRGTGGSQVAGGNWNSAFGVGGFGYPSGVTYACNGHSGGGGGYYGGGGGLSTGDRCHMIGGGGGSSYISGHTGSVAIISESNQSPKPGCTTGTTDNSCSIHYSGKVFTNTVMIDGAGYSWTNVKGTLQQMPNPSGGYYPSGQGHTGNGYARITYLGD